MRIRQLVNAAILPAIFLPGVALATNDYPFHAYGHMSQGRAGVGIALPQDGLAAASNPAGTAFVGSRIDLGATWLRPTRGTDISANSAGLNGSYDGNDSKNFLISEIGYFQQLSAQLAAGVAIFGNGGMNTAYGSNPFRDFGGSGSACGNLEQLFISPSITFKLYENHAGGLAVNFAYGAGSSEHGATWRLSQNGERSVVYAHGVKETVKGSGSIPAALGGGEADIHLSEDIFGIAYGWEL